MMDRDKDREKKREEWSNTRERKTEETEGGRER